MKTYNMYSLPPSVCILFGQTCLNNISHWLKFLLLYLISIVNIATLFHFLMWSIATATYLLAAEGMVLSAVSWDNSNKRVVTLAGFNGLNLFKGAQLWIKFTFVFELYHILCHLIPKVTQLEELQKFVKLQVSILWPMWYF